jgi:hypothetical protein
MLSSPAAVSRTVSSPIHSHLEGDPPEGNHPVYLRLEGDRAEGDRPEDSQRVVYPARYGGPRVAAAYPAAPAAVERLLCVKQAVSRSRRSRDIPSTISPTVGRRRLRRRLVQAAARIERSPEYQRSLADLAQLAASFQAELEPAQRGQWLELEDALLEHVAWLNRSYFHAGAAWGERYGRSQWQAARAVERDARRRARVDVQVMVALAKAVMKLAKR